MASEWHYSRDGEDFGPVSSAELKQLAATGKLLRTDVLWKEGMTEWKPAGEFRKLFPEEETASVILEPEEPAAENLFASLNLDVGRGVKQGAKAKASAGVADNLASLQVDVAAAGRKATSKVKSHARTAGKVAVLAAERTKISTVTLPIAYAELGEHCYCSRTHAEEFADLFAKLDAVQAGIAESGKSAEADGDTIAEKAKAWAEQGMKFAQSQAQGVQAKTLFVQLGKACFNRFGPEAGPEDLVTRIQALRDRLSKLDAEIKTGVNKTGGAKGWLMYGGGALVCLLVVVAIATSSPPSEGRRVGADRPPKAPISALSKGSREPSSKRSKEAPRAGGSLKNTSGTETASVATASAQTATAASGKSGSLAAEYLAMIQDPRQRSCSEVFCSLNRFVGNGSVVPQPGKIDIPLAEIRDSRSVTVMGGPSRDAPSYKWEWQTGGVRVPLKRWLEVLGPTSASPLKEHEPSFDKWDVDGLKTSRGHMGELTEIPYQCVDGVIYLIGCVTEFPGIGKILDPQVVLVIPSADAAKRAEGHKVKARFQLADTRRVLSKYEQGVAQGRLVAINASSIAAQSAKYRDEAAATFWFETVPKFEESAKHSEFFRGYLDGMIEQWKKEGLPVLR
jgi:hypothetical protein